jgi:hypothetical protein
MSEGRSRAEIQLRKGFRELGHQNVSHAFGPNDGNYSKRRGKFRERFALVITAGQVTKHSSTRESFRRP